MELEDVDHLLLEIGSGTIGEDSNLKIMVTRPNIIYTIGEIIVEVTEVIVKLVGKAKIDKKTIKQIKMVK